MEQNWHDIYNTHGVYSAKHKFHKLNHVQYQYIMQNISFVCSMKINIHGMYTMQKKETAQLFSEPPGSVEKDMFLLEMVQTNSG